MDVVRKKILYITYDGLTDPLGQSQILPYIKGLEKYGYYFTILSFEKRERFNKEENNIRKLITGLNIDWAPVWFTANPPLLSKFYDAVQMRNKAVELHKKVQFDMVHCRSYIAADVGIFLKRKFGIKFFFDMRGFWADEKRDAGAWKPTNVLYRKIYNYYKKKEGEYLQNADYIISLTEAGEKEMKTWVCFNPNVPLRVIPCCADMDLFSITDKQQKLKNRKLLCLDEQALILSYLGSIGTWYMLDEMLKLFQKIKTHYPNSKFLFVTHSSPKVILQKIALYNIEEKDVKIIEARRTEVPPFIKASDINVSFIQPVYSKISSSPTKLGEVLSMGIPVFTNSGVGDVEKIIGYTGAGYVFHSFNEKEYDDAIKAIPGLLNKDPLEIRRKAKSVYDLSEGIKRYAECYSSVFNHFYYNP